LTLLINYGSLSGQEVEAHSVAPSWRTQGFRLPGLNGYVLWRTRKYYRKDDAGELHKIITIIIIIIIIIIVVVNKTLKAQSLDAFLRH
jgi:hypothetical protein